MRRSWAAALLGLLGLFASSAYAADSSLARDPDWQLGRNYLAEGKSQEAQNLLTRLLQKYPNEPDLHLFIALAALRTRDTSTAEAEVAKTLSLDPNHVEQ